LKLIFVPESIDEKEQKRERKDCSHSASDKSKADVSSGSSVLGIAVVAFKYDEYNSKLSNINFQNNFLKKNYLILHKKSLKVSISCPNEPAKTQERYFNLKIHLSCGVSLNLIIFPCANT
jgi:hypothetical protein